MYSSRYHSLVIAAVMSNTKGKNTERKLNKLCLWNNKMTIK